MPNLYCVRANYGQYTKYFLKGEYVGIGWFSKKELSQVRTKEDVQKLYKEEYPDDTNPNVIGQQVGQISRFIFDIKKGDYVITPARETEYVYWGIIESDYYFETNEDGCPYNHRKIVKWNKDPLQRSQFSVPFQNIIRSSLTVYRISLASNFFEVIGEKEFISENPSIESGEKAVLKRILELDAKEFEILVTHLLSALGFEAERTGKVGDGGVDATGELDLYNLAKVKIYVQAKRYQIGDRISAKQVKQLRQNIPNNAQGAFITTSDFAKDALKVAVEPGFPRIGTINGEQLVDLLAAKWENLDLPDELKQKMSLKRGLIVE